MKRRKAVYRVIQSIYFAAINEILSLSPALVVTSEQSGSKVGDGRERLTESSSPARHGRRFALFGGVGLVNTATDLAVFAALMAAGLAPVLANGAGFVAANAQSY